MNLKSAELNEAYRAYHAKVIAAIDSVQRRRWPPFDEADERKLARSLSFFDTECTFDVEFYEGRDTDDVAEEEVDAAVDSQ